MQKPGEKREKKRNLNIHPELIKFYIADRHRLSDSLKDKIERTLCWPKKVKMKKKEKKREKKREKKKDLYEISNQVSKDYD